MRNMPIHDILPRVPICAVIFPMPSGPIRCSIIFRSKNEQCQLLLVGGSHPARILVNEHIVNQRAVFGDNFGFIIGTHVFNFTQFQIWVASCLDVVLHDFSGLSFLQDSDGYMWFGSKEGLYRYQGTSVKVFRHIQDDEHSLLDNLVYDMYVDSEGVMWIGTNSGLNRFDKYTETFTSFTYNREDSTSIIRGRIDKITEDKLHRLWLATSGGFSLYDRETGLFKNYVIERPDTFDVMSHYQILYLL